MQQKAAEPEQKSQTIILRVKRSRPTDDDIGELQLTYDERGIKRSRSQLVTEGEALEKGAETTVKVQKVNVKKFGFDLPSMNVPEHRKKVEESLI